MTLLSITAPKNGPVARRAVDQIIPNGQVPFGGFATLMGISQDPKDLSSTNSNSTPPNVLYIFGIAEHGIQLARVLLQNVASFTKWTFFDPQKKTFVSTAPAINEADASKIYLEGSFSSGNIFYSKYSTAHSYSSHFHITRLHTRASLFQSSVDTEHALAHSKYFLKITRLLC